jgi:signal transduction histidine kinase
VSPSSLDRAQLERLLEVGRNLVSELELEPVLGNVLDAARDLTDARYAALGILDRHKQGIERFKYVGIDVETAGRIGALPRGRGLLGELIRDPRPLRLRAVGNHPRAYGFPAGHPEMTSFLGVPVIVRGQAWGNLYLADKRGAEEFSDEDERLVVLLAQWAAVAVDNARLYETAERRRAELERAVRGLQATVALAREVGGETALEPVLELVVKRGRALVEARLFCALLPDPDGLVVAAAAGEVPKEMLGTTFELDGSPFAPLRRSEGGRPGPAVRSLLAGLGIEASTVLLAPLVHRGRAVGMLAALDRLDGEWFSADDELLLSSFSTSAATAVAMVQAVENERLRLSISASERERRRWARELHDDTLQQLGALKVLHDTALLRGDPEVMRGSLQRATAQLDETISGLENLITELRPAALDQLGIAAALEALIDRAERTSRISISVDLDHVFDHGAPRLRPELEATVYRLVQEALNNVIKHAGASEVRVTMVENAETLELVVEDNGCGFDVEAAPQRFGIVGMRERVLLARGRLEIDSAPGEGTRVTARLPLDFVELGRALRPGE